MNGTTIIVIILTALPIIMIGISWWFTIRESRIQREKQIKFLKMQRDKALMDEHMKDLRR